MPSSENSKEQCKMKKCCKMVCYTSKIAVVLVMVTLSVITWKLCGRITKLENQMTEISQNNVVKVNAEQNK